MPGMIRQSDVEEVKARTNLADVIGDYVVLKPAGVGSLKGLCPFHDEHSPSFNVRPQAGFYHCFGCGESGDVYSFLQRIDGLSFVEAVERLAARLGYQLTYDETAGARSDRSGRARLLAANTEAEKFYRASLLRPEAREGRRFLGGRAFDAAAAERFGVGYAPSGWDALTRHLTALGYSKEELVQAGLASLGQRGVYDRFRGRVVWPIRDITGQTVGFGARRLGADDTGPKYLNTPETAIYHKSQVLYGLDVAKRQITRTHRVVVVEGYTDVMACHLAGVETAVATCGTAFGADHAGILRRLLGDEGSAEVIFTFDPDEAGQKAAVHAFSQSHDLAAGRYVAVGPRGLDPCDLRIQAGDVAIRDMIEAKKPLFDFMIRRIVLPFDLDTVDGRAAALMAARPIVASVGDPILRRGYVRHLAGLLGMELDEVAGAVRQVGTPRRGRAVPRRTRGSAAPAGLAEAGPPASRISRPSPHGTASQGLGPLVNAPAGDSRRDGGAGTLRPGEAVPGGAVPGEPGLGAPGGRDAGAEARRPAVPILTSRQGLPRDPDTRLERDALQALLQRPDAPAAELLGRALRSRVDNPSLAMLRDAMLARSGGAPTPDWLADVLHDLPEELRPLAEDLAAAPLPGRDSDDVRAYCQGMARALVARDLQLAKRDLVRRLQRLDPDDVAGRRGLQRQIADAEVERRRLRDE
ncbi:MAG TPA: DNA primase [Microbacteriaceae bacterium]|nr:DNA primase [Microbacteriaceae bacterium]